MSNIHINTIISGAVGSGRNYLSIIYALSIIDDKSIEDLLKEPSDTIRKRFNELSEEGQIFNCTFSENSVYEDFLEGYIGLDPNGQMLYTNGVLKSVALLAKQNIVGCFIEQMPKKDFQLTFNQLYKAFLEEVKSDKISNFISPNNKKYMVHRVEPRGNFYIRGENSFSTYYISRAELKKVFDNGPEIFNIKHDPKAKTVTGTTLNPEPYEAVYQSLIEFEQMYVNELMQKKNLDTNDIGNFDLTQFSKEIETCCKKYILIIDHMDVDNAAKVFGDAITLLEESRRAGKPEETFIYLPYSKMSFSLPPNLYIIGLIGNENNYSNAGNLALFNNFDIIKVEPNSKDIWINDAESLVDEIDMHKLINIINHRMNILLPQTFTINPFIFKSVKTLDDLKEKFEKRLIPQLERAFAGDLSKLRIVIGKDFIGEKKIDPEIDFIDYEKEMFAIPEREFIITKSALWTKDSFKRIYIS
jgi:hypothetical protein